MFALYYRKWPSLKARIIYFLYHSLLLLVSAGIVLVLAQPIHAQTVVFSDTFDVGFDKWEPTRDAAQYWTVENGQLHGTIPRGFTISELVPKDSYWNPDWKNIQYELDFLALSGVDKNISFHFENLQNWYELHFTAGGMEILRLQDGAVPWRAQRPTRLQNNVTYHITLVLNQDRIQVLIDNVLVFDEIDPTFNNTYGKIGLKAGTGSIAPTHIVIDNVTVTSLDAQNTLNIPRVAQNDPAWADDEYDTASVWSPENDSISSWGCALSSMVMVLTHHGITSFQDHTAITPKTLNAWLLQQPDGYIGQGLLNWLAVTRLTHQLSDLFQTPKLEFSFQNTNIRTQLADEFTLHQRPAIINIPGHFLVSEGIVPNTAPQDFYIKDPAYAHTQLSQHQTEPISLRLFTPSQTDLSYFLAIPPSTVSDLTISLAGQPQPTISTEETLSDFQQTNATSNQLVYLQKPANGDYSLSFSGQFGESYSFALLTYTQDGSVTVHTLVGTFGYLPEMYSLTYNKENTTSVLRSEYTLTSFSDELLIAYQESQLTSHFVWYELSRFISLIEKYPQQKSIIQNHSSAFIDTYHHSFTPESKTYFKAKMQSI